MSWSGIRYSDLVGRLCAILLTQLTLHHQNITSSIPWTIIFVVVAHPELWLATLTDVPYCLGSNPGEDMDVWKMILSSWHVGTLNSRRAASSFMRLVELEERCDTPDSLSGCSPSK
ncbi:hypothetical protein TNCV_2204181 [Trichonephila clavipes]|nr:hypothetical protein TNCV_2204181 [Trichonephila clavipes]